MSTEIVLKFEHSKGTIAAAELFQRARLEFTRIAETYTRFDENSLLSQLNQNGTIKPTAELYWLVDLLIELARFSDGGFDPTIIDLLEIHGYRSSFSKAKVSAERKKHRDKIKAVKHYATRRPSWGEISLSKDQIALLPGQRLDLGGIGKGYGISRVADTLRAQTQRFLISAGGDIYTSGDNWRCDLRIGTNPDSEATPEVISVDTSDLAEYLGFTPEQGLAIASSGSWARAIADFNHLLDPKTGGPVTEVSQAFCIGPNPTLADGLATVLNISGSEFLDKISEVYNYQGIILTESGRLFASDKIAKFLK